MVQEYINRQTTIGDLIKSFPDVAPIVTSYGLHCVGCHVAYWETIEQGCQGHGVPEEVIDELILEINEFIEDQAQEAAK